MSHIGMFSFCRLLIAAAICYTGSAWTSPENAVSRRKVVSGIVGTAVGLPPILASAEEEVPNPDRFDVDSFLKTGLVQNPMGVSGQAGELLVFSAAMLGRALLS